LKCSVGIKVTRTLRMFLKKANLGEWKIVWEEYGHFPPALCPI